MRVRVVTTSERGWVYKIKIIGPRTVLGDPTSEGEDFFFTHSYYLCPTLQVKTKEGQSKITNTESGFPGHKRAEFSPITYGTVCLHFAFVFVCLSFEWMLCVCTALFSLSLPLRSLVVGPRGVSLLLFASVPVSSRCTLLLLKLHFALSLLVAACTFPSLTSHCWLTCIGRLVHSLHLSVMVNAPSPHPPSTDCHPGFIVNSKFCQGRLWGAKDCYI